jgi:hypothetical protein
MFCNTSIGITEEQQTKLNKVLYGFHAVLESEVYCEYRKCGNFEHWVNDIFTAV